MRKVKKNQAVRRASAGKAASARKRRRGVTNVARKEKPKPEKKAIQKPTAPVSTFRVRQLDPVQKCGPGTSVQRLFRVDESIDGVVKLHLVFLDRHGWYCEHGPDCPAVSRARSHTATHTRST